MALGAPARPYLVYTSAGEHANIFQWMEGRRNFDLWITCYGDQGNRYRQVASYYNRRKGSKFQNLHHAYRHWRHLLATTVLLCATPWRSSSSPQTTDPVTEWSIAASNAAAATPMPPLKTPITLAILMAQLPDSTARAAGARLGVVVSRTLLKNRAEDGRTAAVPYTPGGGAGAWIPTPPTFLPATTAILGRITPFTMASPSQFRPSGPPRLRSKKWRDDFNEVKRMGARTGSARTPEQTETALFWEPLAGTVWPATIRRLARDRSLDLASSARFQAAAFAAFADGLIGCWDAKFHFNFWRPVTAIQHGDQDGDDATEPDPAWEPLAVTPNFPEYPSGHACATAAVAYTIDDFFGGDVIIPARNVVTGQERVYRRAADVVEEVVEARMLLGLHFRAGDEDGAELGRKIARQIRSHWFRPKR